MAPFFVIATATTATVKLWLSARSIGIGKSMAAKRRDPRHYHVAIEIDRSRWSLEKDGKMRGDVCALSISAEPVMIYREQHPNRHGKRES